MSRYTHCSTLFLASLGANPSLVTMATQNYTRCTARDMENARAYAPTRDRSYTKPRCSHAPSQPCCFHTPRHSSLKIEVARVERKEGLERLEHESLTAAFAYAVLKGAPSAPFQVQLVARAHEEALGQKLGNAGPAALVALDVVVVEIDQHVGCRVASAIAAGEDQVRMAGLLCGEEMAKGEIVP